MKSVTNLLDEYKLLTGWLTSVILCWPEFLLSP